MSARVVAMQSAGSMARKESAAWPRVAILCRGSLDTLDVRCDPPFQGLEASGDVLVEGELGSCKVGPHAVALFVAPSLHAPPEKSGSSIASGCGPGVSRKRSGQAFRRSKRLARMYVLVRGVGVVIVAAGGRATVPATHASTITRGEAPSEREGGTATEGVGLTHSPGEGRAPARCFKRHAVSGTL